MTRKNQYTAKQFIDAIPGTGGIVATIAKRVACDWQTAKKYIDTFPSVQRAYQNECETVADMAESVLVKSIQAGDTGDAKWFLSRIRRGKFATQENIDVTSDGKRIKAYAVVSPDDWTDDNAD